MAQSQQGLVSTEVETLSHVMGLMEAFRAFDSDGDGLITMEELVGIMSSVGYNLRGEEARSIMQNHGKSVDGLMTLTEFLEFNTKDMDLGNMANCLRVAVQALDMDADDGLTGGELFEVIRDNGMGLSMEVCQQIIESMDGDRDGEVNFEDFQLIINSLL